MATNFDDLFKDVPEQLPQLDQETADSFFADAPQLPGPTAGERLKGFGLSLLKGFPQAGKAVSALGALAIPFRNVFKGERNPGEKAVEFFDRGMEAVESFQPESVKRSRERGFVKTDLTTGEFEGLQVPSVEAISDPLLASLPQLPFFLGGGLGAGRLLEAAKVSPRLAKAFGFGATNAALVAPIEYFETLEAARAEGLSEEEAKARANKALALNIPLTAATGAGGAAVAGLVGAASKTLPRALAKGFAAESPFEFIEEGGAGPIQDIAMERPINVPAALDAALIGGASGGLPGSAIAGIEQVGNRGDVAPEIDPAIASEVLRALDPRLVAEPAPVVEELITPDIIEQARVAMGVPEQAPAQQAPVEQANVAQPTDIPPRAPVEAPVAAEATPEVTEPVGREALPQVKNEEGQWVDGDPRLMRQEYRGGLVQLTSELTKGGGIALVQQGGPRRADGSEKQSSEDVIRTPSENPAWFQPLSASTGMSTVGVKNAVRAALEGRKLGVRQAEVVDIMLGLVQDARTGVDPTFGPEFDSWRDMLNGFRAMRAKDRAAAAEAEFGNLEGWAPELAEEAADRYSQLYEEYSNDVAPEIGQADQGTSDTGREGRQVSRDETQGQPAEGQLIAGPTAQEQIAAAEQESETRRNRLGEDEVPVESGAGELFAGNQPGARPEQVDIESAVSPNKLFTEDAAQAARERLKSKLGTTRSGLDPEMLKDATIVAGFHVERGARSFAAFSKAMIKDFGDAIKPFLRDLYDRIRSENQFEGMDPPAATETEPQAAAPEGPTATSTKNVVAEREREARGLDPIIKEARQSHPEVMERAEAELAENPDRPDEILAELSNSMTRDISTTDEAILLIEKRTVMNDRLAQAERAANEKLTEDQRKVARQRWRELEARLEEIDQATTSSGTEWGRFGAFRNRMLAEDFTFESMERQARALRGRPLTPEESATIKSLAEKIDRLEKALQKKSKRVGDAQLKVDTQAIYNQIAKQFEARQKKKLKIRSLSDRLNKEADKSRAYIKANFARANSGLDPIMVGHMVTVGASHIVNGAATVAEFIDAMRLDLGDRIFRHIEADIDEIHRRAQEMVNESGEKTTQDVVLEIKALTEAGEPLSHRAVFELAHAHVMQGVRGENEVMKAVFDDLAPFIEGLTERDVRRAFSEYGKTKFPSKEDDLKTLRELRVLVRMQESIDRLRENLPALKTGQQRDKATQKIRDKQRELNILLKRRERANPVASPEKLAGINEVRITRLVNRIEELEREIETGQKPEKGEPVPDSPEVIELKKKRDALVERLREIEQAKQRVVTPEEKYNIRRGRELRRQLAEVKKRMADKDYAPRKRPVPPGLTKENEQLAFELAKAKMEFKQDQLQWELKHAPVGTKIFRAIGEGLNLSRMIITSFDLSAVGIQGGFAVLGNPHIAYKSFMPMFRSLKSEEAAHAVETQTREMADTPLHKNSGLELTDINTLLLSRLEEVYKSRLTTKIPGVAMSARAFVAFLNRLRVDLFNSMIETLGGPNVVTKEQAQQVANYVNVALGRGAIGNRNKHIATGASTIFFAPRLVASRFNLLFGQPFYKGTKQVNKMIAGHYARYFIALNLILGVASLFSDEDEDDLPTITLDPTSTDFGKVMIGNTRIDFMAGLRPPIVLLSRLIAGSKRDRSGNVIPIRNMYRIPREGLDPDEMVNGFGDNAADITWRFIRSKFAPPITAIMNLFAGEDVVGQPASLESEAIGLITPLSIADFMDALEEQGLAKTSAMQVLATFGFAMNTYGNRRYYENKGAVNRILDEVTKQVRSVPENQQAAEFEKMKAKYPALLEKISLQRYAMTADNIRRGRAGRMFPGSKNRLALVGLPKNLLRNKDLTELRQDIERLKIGRPISYGQLFELADESEIAKEASESRNVDPKSRAPRGLVRKIRKELQRIEREIQDKDAEKFKELKKAAG